MNLVKRAASKLDRAPILLAHHPLCGRFDDHMLVIKGRKVCRGCATVYPSALATALAFLLLGPLEFALVMTLALSFFMLNLLRLLRKDHRYSIIFNMFLGISLAAAVFAAIYAPTELKIIVIPGELGLAAAFSFLKGRRVFAECRGCERYAEFPSCVVPTIVTDELESTNADPK